jgi:hypothetical protein
MVIFQDILPRQVSPHSQDTLQNEKLSRENFHFAKFLRAGSSWRAPE